MREGLSYVFKHPVLRNISFMMLLVNFFGATAYFQLVLFAHERLAAERQPVGSALRLGQCRRAVDFHAGGAVAPPLVVQPGCAQRSGGERGGHVLVRLDDELLGGLADLGHHRRRNVLFNINTSSLRQTIIPNHLLGRVMSVAMTMSSCAVPFGALLGGYAIEQSSVRAVYAAIGAAVVLIALLFSLGPVGRANRYLTSAASAAARVSA